MAASRYQPYFNPTHKSQNPFGINNHLVVGKFLDDRSFSELRIQKWVFDEWKTFRLISVVKIKDCFLFNCTDQRDMYALINIGTAAYQAVLLVFKPWNPSSSFMDIVFDPATLRVRLDDFPLNLHEVRPIELFLEKLGRIDCLEVLSPFTGIICSIRAKLSIPIFMPLPPGFFLAQLNTESKWMNFKFENVFIFCSTCGKIGHKEKNCRASPGMITASLNCIGNFCEISEGLIPKLSNKNIGLARIEKFRSSKLDLFTALKPLRQCNEQRHSTCSPKHFTTLGAEHPPMSSVDSPVLKQPEPTKLKNYASPMPKTPIPSAINLISNLKSHHSNFILPRKREPPDPSYPKNQKKLRSNVGAVPDLQLDHSGFEAKSSSRTFVVSPSVDFVSSSTIMVTSSTGIINSEGGVADLPKTVYSDGTRLDEAIPMDCTSSSLPRSLDILILSSLPSG